MEQLVKTRLKEADDYLQKAKEELCKPEEDVVPFSVYQSAFRSTMNCLSSYLLEHDELLPDAPTVEVLLDNCRKVNSKFNDLDLTSMYNPTEKDEDVWMSVAAAEKFLALAEKTRKMVTQA